MRVASARVPEGVGTPPDMTPRKPLYIISEARVTLDGDYHDVVRYLRIVTGSVCA